MADQETASEALARVVSPLDEHQAATLRESFGAMFDRVEAWTAEARTIEVTSEDQTRLMGRARSLRLEIREVRIALAKKRKELKERVLIEGRAIDGAYNVFESLADPLERYLKEQETFAARAEAARQQAEAERIAGIQNARIEALQALGQEVFPDDLGVMPEANWKRLLADAKAEKKARDAEAARVRVEALNQENARRKAAAEAKAKADRQEAENAKLRAENARLKAQQPPAMRPMAPTAVLPTAAKSSLEQDLIVAMRAIADGQEPRARGIARATLKKWNLLG